MIRVFFRNRIGKDTKVLGTGPIVMGPPMFRGLPLTDPTNQYVTYVDLDTTEQEAFEVDSIGRTVRKVVEGTLVARDQGDLDTDRTRASVIQLEAKEAIDAVLQGRERTTWLMYAIDNIYMLLREIQEKAGILDSALTVDGQEALAQAEYIRSNISIPAVVAMMNRDALLASLDEEDFNG